MKFNIGDRVMVSSTCDSYGITKFGSIGEVTSILINNSLDIKFSIITSEYQKYVNRTFPIKRNHLINLNNYPLFNILYDV